MNQLHTLKQFTTVVADTGDFLQIAEFKPTDATTNPSLILKAVQKPEYAPLMQEVMTEHRSAPLDEQMDRLLVRFGCKILEVVPGRVSTEVDARLGFDTEATLKRARRVISLYGAQGVASSRVLIKVAATWEGILAAKQLELEGIHTNLTLLFSKCQAIQCGDSGVKLISPFVGRIYDWHKKAAGAAWNESERSGANDPGVRSVTDIFNYYKHFGIKTEIMGASFRNLGQITALAGCDLLTIAPELLSGLAQTEVPLVKALSAEAAAGMVIEPIHYNESSFRFALNADACATEKLAEGIRAFALDTEKLEALMKAV